MKQQQTHIGLQYNYVYNTHENALKLASQLNHEQMQHSYEQKLDHGR